MENPPVFDALMNSISLNGFEKLIEELEGKEGCEWVPLGGRPNNKATVEAAGDPGRSIVERLTNGIDAIIEHQHKEHNGVPDCHSPKQAGQAWFGIPEEGLSALSNAQRRALAQKIQIKMLPGDNKDARIVEIRDFGTGLSPERMPDTILSLNESNKTTKYYLAGAYGQGGSSTFASCKFTIIASKADGDTVGFTIVKRQIINYKYANYVYLVCDGKVFTATKDTESFPRGTVVRHLGYDLSGYAQPLGPNSLYGLLNQTLFDPVLPVWLINDVHNYRRVIKGVRNALNGAVDEGDESKGPQLAHYIKMFHLNLRDFGSVGVEYWVLESPTKENKYPSKSYVNPSKPIILTINGQNQHEISQLLIRRRADLPYLSNRLICHIDCNNLNLEAKGALFISNREGARRGTILEVLENELVQIFQSDDDLVRLNKEAQKQGYKERDEKTEREIRIEVSKILKMQGVDVGESFGAVAAVQGVQEDKPVNPRPPRPTPIPKTIELKDPPTYIKLIWSDDSDITFYPEQRRWLRIETDALSNYHNSTNVSLSRINVICSDPESVQLLGTTPLSGGRMRINLSADAKAKISDKSTIRVELSRTGLPTLSDERPIRIIDKPVAKQQTQKTSFPPFDFTPIDPDHPKWAVLTWPDDVNEVAYEAQMEDGVLMIYYSTEFPKFTEKKSTHDKKDSEKGKSFVNKYQIWLVVHALLVVQKKNQSKATDEPDDITLIEQQENQERIRAATLAVIFADREVKNPVLESDDNE